MAHGTFVHRATSHLRARFSLPIQMCLENILISFKATFYCYTFAVKTIFFSPPKTKSLGLEQIANNFLVE
jgi:hypothetical protein